MAEQKHVSGMHVGPLLSEEEHDAIVETRKRRKQAARQGADKRASKRPDESGDSQDTPKPKG
jgi:hypothetical protein